MAKIVKAKKVYHDIDYASVKINSEGKPEIFTGTLSGEGYCSDKAAEVAIRKHGITGQVTEVRNVAQTYEMPADEFFSYAKPVVDEVAAPSETPTIL